MAFTRIQFCAKRMASPTESACPRFRTGRRRIARLRSSRASPRTRLASSRPPIALACLETSSTVLITARDQPLPACSALLGATARPITTSCRPDASRSRTPIAYILPTTAPPRPPLSSIQSPTSSHRQQPSSRSLTTSSFQPTTADRRPSARVFRTATALVQPSTSSSRTHTAVCALPTSLAAPSLAFIAPATAHHRRARAAPGTLHDS